MAKRQNTLRAVPAGVKPGQEAKTASDARPIVISGPAMAQNVVALLQEFYTGESEGDGFTDDAVAGMYFLLGAVRDVLEREAGNG